MKWKITEMRSALPAVVLLAFFAVAVSAQEALVRVRGTVKDAS